MALEFEDITGKIIGAATEVHKTLGPGFLEAIYESALVLELQHRGMVFHQQLSVPTKRVSVEVGEPRSPAFLSGHPRAFTARLVRHAASDRA